MKKEAKPYQNQDPKYVAIQIANIIHILMDKMTLEGKAKSYPNLKNKIQNLNTLEISNKSSTGGAAIGTSISIIKNILNGKDPYFINLVLKELERELIR